MAESPMARFREQITCHRHLTSPPEGTLAHTSRVALPLFCIPLLLFNLLTCIPCSAVAQTQPQTDLAAKNILVLHAFEANAPLFQETDRALAKALQSGGVPLVNQFFQYLDLRRNQDPEYRKLLVEYMRVLYRDCRFDMIITMYPEALDFVLNEGQAILPGIPILALYLPADSEPPKADRLIFRHAAALDMLGTLQAALKLFPSAKRVYVVSGAHLGDRQQEARARREFKPWEGSLEFHYLSEIPLEEALATLVDTPHDAVVLLLPISNDVSGKSYMTPDVAKQISQVSAAPVFGLLEVGLGHGIVGGSLFSFERVGANAGQLALDILRGGSSAGSVDQFLNVPPVPMFDWRQLKRWNLSEGALPKGSIVINRELTLWDFRFYIIGALAFIMAQSCLIAGLLINKRRRRSAEESLRQKTEELAQFFNISLDLLCIANTQGYLLLLNPAWEKVLGYTREELMAKQFMDFVHPDDLERTSEAISTLASQQNVIHFENRYRSKDGTYRWLEWTSAPAGNLIYAAARDLTERLKAEAEDQQRREELAHVTRIAMMGELTTSLAHEINQPLTAIQSNAQAAQRFLAQAPPDIDEVRQILDDIIRDDRRASDVVRKVRALVKKEKPCLEPLDLNELIPQVVDLIRGDSLLQGLSIQTDLSPGLATIHGDHIQLQQVVLNLIVNGAAAMKNAAPAQRKIVVRTAMPDSLTVKAFVTDFGTGIDEHHIDRLFEPFYTTKPQGLGMGLSISKSIIEAHGGRIEASNNQEGGATFAFTLPALKGDPL